MVIQSERFEDAGFTAIQSSLLRDLLEEKINGVNTRIDSVNTRIDSLDKRVEAETRTIKWMVGIGIGALGLALTGLTITIIVLMT